jgi:hypothetical protein
LTLTQISPSNIFASSDWKDRETRQSLWKRCGKVLLLKVAKGISQPATQHSSGVEQKRK